MAIPDFQQMMLPMLALAADGEVHSVADMRDPLAERFGVDDAEREELLPNGKQSRFNNNVAWAKVHLGRAGLVETPSKGRLKISDLGRQVLEDPPVTLDLEFLRTLADDDNSRNVSRQIGNAIGDAVIVTGDHNVSIAAGALVGRDTEIDADGDRQILSEDQAFERIAAAARLNLTQLGRNIEQARMESSQFFKLTLAFSSVGFAVVVVAIVFLLFGQTTAGIVSAISASIPEVTAALFFSKDRELRKTIESYHQHILQSQQILTMVDVATTITNESERDRLKRSIVFKVLDVPDLDPEDATS